MGETITEVDEMNECEECEQGEDACPKHATLIHESWHATGMWWVRFEMCHPECPGRKVPQKEAL